MTTARPPSDALVFFGASGDLAYKKIFPALYAMKKHGTLEIPVIGVASSKWTLESLRERARDSIATHCVVDDKDALDRLVASIGYVDGDYRDADTFVRLRSELGDARRPAHYLAIPPSLFQAVVEGLGASGSATDARVIVEKPFGRDLASAQQLNACLLSVFSEDAIFRIDHYLGKEAVQNLVYFRFANSFLEPIWNRDHVASVQVTMAESFGVEGRGRFYEEVGTLRDVVQNHLLQTVSLLAMEPPIEVGAEALRDEKERLFRAMRPLRRDDLVRGQFEGYHDEDGVAPDSDVETFAAVRLHIDSWRWAGVPFYIHAGKHLPLNVTEVVAELKKPPLDVFGEADTAGSNYMRFRLAPEVVIALGTRTKKPGEDWVGRPLELDLCDNETDVMSEYERLLGDALDGESLLFARQDGVEEAWSVVDPVLHDHDDAIPYAKGSWGPAAADALTAEVGGWHRPT